MAYPEITMATETIHNPKNPRHFMRVKPVNRKVRITRGGDVVAETTSAVRVIELARDVLDPVLYLPRDDVTAPLDLIAGKTTHCPLKGDASYYALDQEEVAWSYETPLDFCGVLKGLIAFYPDKVTIVEHGLDDTSQ